MEVQLRDAFIPIMGSEVSQWSPSEPIYMSVCLSISLSLRLSVSVSGHPRRFLVIIRAARNCMQRMQTQATESNPLSGSIIFPSVHPSDCLRYFFNFLLVLISSVGVQPHDTFILIFDQVINC